MRGKWKCEHFRRVAKFAAAGMWRARKLLAKKRVSNDARREHGDDHRKLKARRFVRNDKDSTYSAIAVAVPSRQPHRRRISICGQRQ
jgi:hypothetical protein